ncbi:RimK family alpha-L-glutamate ligase [Virgibacillus kekensis]|uniref:RimK family alpha-L-glutamate ligase n=1 Tax=Virgibacillus kekensis TaxID=202261 RepID=A0ABV9DN09_9BACI
MNLKGWIIYNGYLPGAKFRDFAEWIHEAAQRQDVHTEIYKNNELLSLLSTDELGIVNNPNNLLPDFVVFTDKDIYLARQLELLGVRVYNSARTIETSDDKIATYQAMAAQGLPVPRTVVAPKVFVRTDTFKPTDFDQAADTLGFPMVIKEAFGSFGEQVYLVHSSDELHTKVHALQGRPFMLQEFVSSSSGRDIRLQVVGDNVVAAMARFAADDFRANVTAGGTMENYHPTTEEKSTAIAAAKAIGADFAGVDLLFGPDDTTIICEINSNAHIRNLYDCTGINAADFIISHILKTLPGGEHS